MKILSIDYGTKNIGLAMSDDEQKIAFAYNTLITRNKKSAFAQKNPNVTADRQETRNRIIDDIINICKLEKVERVIVGLPINLSRQKTQSTELIFKFIKELENTLNIPIETEDERLTTVQASRLENKNARNIDELSAQILLQSWLDRNKE